MTAYFPEAAIRFAPTGVAADAIRSGVLAEIWNPSSCDSLPELFRRGGELLLLVDRRGG